MAAGRSASSSRLTSATSRISLRAGFSGHDGVFPVAASCDSRAMPVRLHINVDHVATVRNARGTRYPDPVLAAQLCEAAGADGITAHLREDRRHIRDEGVT